MPKCILGNPIQLRKSIKKRDITPSEYARIISMTTDEYFKNLHYFYRTKPNYLRERECTKEVQNSEVSLKDTLLQPFPSEIVFQNYEPHKTYKLPLILENNDKVAHSCHVIMEKSPYFEISLSGRGGSKVAAGLSAMYIVQFTPDSRKDYRHEVTCITEREIFFIPIYCMGPRAILDLPDKIDLNSTSIRCRKDKIMSVRNVGNCSAKLFLETRPPFSVYPSNGVIPPGESLEMVVTFLPTSTGDFIGELSVSGDTGEKISAKLLGTGVESCVFLEATTCTAEETYIGLSTQKVVKIVNDSEDKAEFNWSPFETKEDEAAGEKLLISVISNTYRSSQTDLDKKLAFWLKKFVGKDLPYPANLETSENVAFGIEPKCGQILPRSTKEFILSFSPEKARTFTQNLYCEVTGRVERLRLQATGTGVGPKIKFSFRCLDMGKIFIGAKHVYELVLSNIGRIDAMFSIQAPASEFAKCFTTTPDDGLICPGGYQAICVEFCSPNRLGALSERFGIIFDGCTQPEYVTFRGQVVGPTFYFDVSELNFQQVSSGFSREISTTLYNSSLISMRFKLRVMVQGHTAYVQGTQSNELNSKSQQESGQSEDLVSRESSIGTAGPCEEFDINPDTGLLQAMSSTEISVRYHPKQLGTHEYFLVVDVDGVGTDLYSLPVKAECICPKISITPGQVSMGRCFLRYPYPITFVLTNHSKQPARFALLNQSKEDTDNGDSYYLRYVSSIPQNEIKPNESVDLTVIFTAYQTGKLDRCMNVMICEHESIDVHISCECEGPVLHVEPTSLNWGTISVLQPAVKHIQLTNESTIPAIFSGKMKIRNDYATSDLFSD